MNLGQQFEQQIERAISLVESKVLRIGGQYHDFSFLCAAYAMLRSASARDEVPLHMQLMLDRLVRLYCRVVDGQEQNSETPTTLMGVNAQSELTESASMVRAGLTPMILTSVLTREVSTLQPPREAPTQLQYTHINDITLGVQFSQY
jgi:hypothetical protein